MGDPGKDVLRIYDGNVPGRGNGWKDCTGTDCKCIYRKSKQEKSCRMPGFYSRIIDGFSGADRICIVNYAV